MTWDLRKTQTLLLSALLIAAVGISIPGGVDFVVYHFAAVSSYAHPDQVYTQPAGSGGYYYYGPIFLVLVHPLGLLSFPIAKGVWIFALAAAFVFLWRSFRALFPTLFTNPWLWAWAFVFSINSIHSNFQSLNIQLFLLAMLVAAELLCEQGSPGAQICAGILCALAACIKVYPAFLLLFHWVLDGHRFRAGAVLGVLLSVALPFLVFGTGPAYEYWMGFFQNLFAFSSRNSVLQIADLLCLPSLLYRWTVAQGASPLVYRILLVAIAGALAFCFLSWVASAKKTHPLAPQARRGFWAMALALMVFLNPSSYTHYFVFYVPLLFWFLNGLAGKTAETWISGTLVLMCTGFMAFSTDFVIGNTLNDQLEKWNLPTFAVILMMGTIAVQLARNNRTFRATLRPSAAIP